MLKLNKPLALNENVRLGRKALPGANTRAYFASSLVMKSKSHTKLSPVTFSIKLFTVAIKSES